MAVCMDTFFIFNSFIMITSTIFIICFCKPPRQKNSCHVREMTNSMRAAPISDAIPDSTRTALDKEEKKKRSKDSSKKSNKKNKKKKSADSSMKISKKSSKSKKSKKSEKGKKPEARGRDEGENSTQRSGAAETNGPPVTAKSALSKTAKSVPNAPNTSVKPTSLAANSPAPSYTNPGTPAANSVPDTANPRSLPVGIPGAPGCQSMPAF
ncbi:uncharacterized protein CELE_Y50E8A.10 [Caenorhabditis elegans]|uniref:Uncharacterized protein n=1 Tax=Caenorhabditis elegans TaxID=6239 RepID=Q9NAE8_CAEEL|nr:Uncharacterized protein CELE_Y50E8A.10 [Caenorhabditis elegans]CAB55058.1 Uncharacterized protein CELE_Y50E8A.10 [Caenorhabditis elegans]|eukprot:NP_506647.1 Uncharacterized protein CELE_Y50E8A.10 [Caenorhabditis elegans]